MSGSLFDLITQQLKPGMLEQLGAQLGTNQQQTQKGIEAAIPAILGQLARNSRSKGGAEALQQAIQKDHGGGLLENLGDFFGERPSTRDDRMLDHIFGQRREQIQQGLGQATGLDTGKIGDLLGKLGPLVMGGIGKATQGGQVGFDQLGSMLGQERQQMKQKTGGVFGLVEKMLDVDGDGDVDAGDLIQGAMGGRKKGLLGSLLGGLLGRRR